MKSRISRLQELRHVVLCLYSPSSPYLKTLPRKKEMRDYDGGREASVGERKRGGVARESQNEGRERVFEMQPCEFDSRYG